MNAESATSQVVPLPPLNDELIRKSCGNNAIWSDSRRFPRKSVNVKCVVETSSTYKNSGHDSQHQLVWLRDLARGGARFIHGAQLFPGERCTLIMSLESRLQLEVVWCRRLADQTYLTGCRFKSRGNAAPKSE